MKNIIKLTKEYPEIGVLHYDLTEKTYIQYNLKEQYMAASIIKLPVMSTLYKLYNEGKVDIKKKYNLEPKFILPSCGVVSYLDPLNSYSIEDLCRLMIIVSDNSATNFLIDYLGIDTINAASSEMGMTQTTLKRMLFDEEASLSGLENSFSPMEICSFFENIYRGKLVNREISENMLKILINQQQNDIIPFYLPDDIEIAHKTGLDENICIDAGIVFSEKPYVLCLCCDNRDYKEVREPMSRLSELFYKFPSSSNQVE